MLVFSLVMTPTAAGETCGGCGCCLGLGSLPCQPLRAAELVTLCPVRDPYGMGWVGMKEGISVAWWDAFTRVGREGHCSSLGFKSLLVGGKPNPYLPLGSCVGSGVGNVVVVLSACPCLALGGCSMLGLSRSGMVVTPSLSLPAVI